MSAAVWIAITMAVTAVGAGAAWAQTPPAEPPTGPATPEWDQFPRPTFPEEAVRQRIDSARVVLSCGVRANGSFVDCTVVSEDPPDWGFGREALRAARRARLTRASAATFAPGQLVTFPISWRTVVYDPRP